MNHPALPPHQTASMALSSPALPILRYGKRRLSVTENRVLSKPWHWAN